MFSDSRSIQLHNSCLHATRLHMTSFLKRYIFQSLFLIIHVCIWIGLCESECRCLWRPEASDASEAIVISDCVWWKLNSEPSIAREHQVLLSAELSLQPQHMDCYCYLVNNDIILSIYIGALWYGDRGYLIIPRIGRWSHLQVVAVINSFPPNPSMHATLDRVSW